MGLFLAETGCVTNRPSIVVVGYIMIQALSFRKKQHAIFFVLYRNKSLTYVYVSWSTSELSMALAL